MDIKNFHIKIPTWKNGVWVNDTEFNDLIEFRNFVKTTFKEPGKYELDDTSFMFNEQARLFRQQHDVYCLHPFLSIDYKKYWDREKQKNRNGCIFIQGNKQWYLPRDYYMWINFLPIYDKIKKDFDFPEIWDVQLHIALYELLAELHWKHVSILKKRQIASSYFHMAKMINQVWFEKGPILKIGASLKDYINLSGSWKFLAEYRAFLNGNTAWYRPMEPGKVLEWQQKIEVRKGNRKKEVGLKGMIQGMSFEQSDTKGVGGPCTIFFYEEGGIAPKADITYEFLKPAMQAGDITTGIFIIAGSVGKLKDAEPLKELTNYPERNDIYAVETDLIDEKGTRGMRGLFIPEQWAMPPYIDKYGNSEVEKALAAIEGNHIKWKKDLSPERYQLRVSQHPRNIKEAFASREESKFPLALIEHQEMAISDGEYPYELVILEESIQGEIIVRKTNKPPINQFPIDKRLEDKSGSIIVWERPDKNLSMGTYIASIDPVAEGKTTTSESLVSIYIYKLPTYVKRYTENGVENFIEGDKIVCTWCGRFDDINDTHKRLELIIEWYMARALIENNVSLFIRHMIKERKQKYLIPKTEMLFLKDAQSNKSVYQEYGWRNTGKIFDKHLLSYLIEWLKEVVEEDVDDVGVIIKKYYGIRRVPDVMALTEMKAYREGLNVDRLISLGALIAYIKILESNTSKKVKVENQVVTDLENSENLYKLKSTAFRNLGKNRNQLTKGKVRTPFKYRK